jgi:hypothetical protein
MTHGETSAERAAGRQGRRAGDRRCLAARPGPALLEVIARRLGQAAGEHGGEDISATYLTSAPDQAA